MKKPLYLIMFFLFQAGDLLQAQSPCGTASAPELHHPASSGSILSRGGGPLIIPVVFHVFYSDLLYPITPEQLMIALNLCNQQLRGINPEADEVIRHFRILQEILELN